MKKEFLSFLACLLLGVGYSCKTDKQPGLTTIFLNPDQSKKIELEAISESISVIALETSDNLSDCFGAGLEMLQRDYLCVG